MLHRCLATAIVALIALAPLHAQPAAPTDFPLLPRELEIELALSAAPPHLREGAALLVLDPTGYVSARTGTNAYTCVVSRRSGDVFPVCWDAEGTRALLPVDLDAATLRLSGTSNAEIDRQVADGFATGRYRAPSRTGLAYMLSSLRYRIDEEGHVTKANPLPHVMFYGPQLTDADIGGAGGSTVFMNKVGPDGMVIVPVGSAERQVIVDASTSLTTRLEQHIGYRPQ